jgi:hypothetical protein
MAIMYYIRITNPNNVSLFPPSMSSYSEQLMVKSNNVSTLSSPSNTILHIFANQTDLNAYITSISLTSSQSAALTEWKTTNNITFNYAVYELVDSAGITPPTPY